MTLIKLFLKGFLMGTTDIIPGISGGTVALLLGIYQEFIESLANINLKFLFQLKIKGFFKSINWKFFIPLGLGIIAAVLSLSHLLSWLLEAYPIYIWSLFFGLVFSSVLFLIEDYRCYRPVPFILMIIGAGIGYSIASLGSIAFPESTPFLVLGGLLASLAMILPGISGSYILVLIGLYRPVLSYVKGIQAIPLLTFCTGIGLGILFGSKLLKKLFSRYPTQVYSILFGFILGSLPKIWPWHSVSGDLRLPYWNVPSDLKSFIVLLVASFSVTFIMKRTRVK